MRWIWAAVLLAGCASQQLEKGLTALKGQPIQRVVKCWGYPAAERSVMGQKLYVWSTRSTVYLPSPITGSVGNSPVNLTADEPLTAACTVQIAVDTHEAITGFQWEGNEAGCSQFSRRLDCE